MNEKQKRKLAKSCNGKKERKKKVWSISIYVERKKQTNKREALTPPASPFIKFIPFPGQTIRRVLTNASTPTYPDLTQNPSTNQSARRLNLNASNLTLVYHFVEFYFRLINFQQLFIGLLLQYKNRCTDESTPPAIVLSGGWFNNWLVWLSVITFRLVLTLCCVTDVYMEVNTGQFCHRRRKDQLQQKYA